MNLGNTFFVFLVFICVFISTFQKIETANLDESEIYIMIVIIEFEVIAIRNHSTQLIVLDARTKSECTILESLFQFVCSCL